VPHVLNGLPSSSPRDELIELITHVAFYSCWPTVSTAIGIVREAFNDAPGN
jgi:4-carboxymuconolactone decarboxylase